MSVCLHVGCSKESIIRVDPEEFRQLHAKIQHTEDPLPVESRFPEPLPLQPEPPAADVAAGVTGGKQISASDCRIAVMPAKDVFGSRSLAFKTSALVYTT